MFKSALTKGGTTIMCHRSAPPPRARRSGNAVAGIAVLAIVFSPILWPLVPAMGVLIVAIEVGDRVSPQAMARMRAKINTHFSLL